MLQSNLSPAKNDLQLIKDLINYEEIHAEIAKETLKLISSHLWYLSETLIGMAFFDRTTDLDTKKMMIAALKNPGHVENPKRIKIDLNFIVNQTLADFVTENTLIFFNSFFKSHTLDFLNLDPNEWYENDHYLEAENLVNNLIVVNDVAERAVSLVKKYNDKFTKNED